MAERGVHNDFSGSARTALQTGSVGTVVFKYESDDVPVPQQLPMATTNFVNQYSVLARLGEAVRTIGAPRVYCVVGSPGVGKTAVVVHWAHLHKDQFPGDHVADTGQGHQRGARRGDCVGQGVGHGGNPAVQPAQFGHELGGQLAHRPAERVAWSSAS